MCLVITEKYARRPSFKDDGDRESVGGERVGDLVQQLDCPCDLCSSLKRATTAHANFRVVRQRASFPNHENNWSWRLILVVAANAQKCSLHSLPVLVGTFRRRTALASGIGNQGCCDIIPKRSPVGPSIPNNFQHLRVLRFLAMNRRRKRGDGRPVSSIKTKSRSVAEPTSTKREATLVRRHSDTKPSNTLECKIVGKRKASLTSHIPWRTPE